MHFHDAIRRGPHFDLRLGDPETGFAHSWALPAKWPSANESVHAIHQPTHTLKYMDFSGKIPEGVYGAGNVEIKDRKKVEVIKSSADSIRFNKDSQEYVLFKLKDNIWKLHNKGETKEASLQSTLLPHQQRVVDRIQQQDQPGLVVVHGLGTGKTLSSLGAIDVLGKPATTIVPASLRPNYQKEIEKHITPGTDPGIQVQSLQNLARTHTPLHTGTLVVDESHRLRDASSSSAKSIAEAEAEKRLLLTASPFYNHPSDIASLINIAAGQKILPSNPKEFSKQYITREQVRPGFIDSLRGVKPGEVQKLNPHKEQELRDIFGKWIDYHQNAPGDPNFPSVKEETVNVPMTDPQKDLYNYSMGKLPLWLRMKVKMGLPPNMQEAAQLNAFLNSVRQISNTTRHVNPNADAQEPKLQRAAQDMADLLSHNERAKGVAYSNYLESGLVPYANLLKQKNIPYGMFTGEEKEDAKAQMIKDYNEGKIRALLLSSAGGEGLDLKGTRMLQLLDPHWNEEKLHQIIGRGARYKSHEHLSPEEREVAVRRYLSVYPETLSQRMGIGSRDKGVDEYLMMLSKQKTDLINQFQGLFPQG